MALPRAPSSISSPMLHIAHTRAPLSRGKGVGQRCGSTRGQALQQPVCETTRGLGSQVPLVDVVLVAVVISTRFVRLRLGTFPRAVQAVAVWARARAALGLQVRCRRGCSEGESLQRRGFKGRGYQHSKAKRQRYPQLVTNSHKQSYIGHARGPSYPAQVRGELGQAAGGGSLQSPHTCGDSWPCQRWRQPSRERPLPTCRAIWSQSDSYRATASSRRCRSSSLHWITYNKGRQAGHGERQWPWLRTARRSAPRGVM